MGVVDPHELSRGAQTVLRAMGWFPGRKVPTSDWETLLATDGFVAHDFARMSMSEFGGLELSEGRVVLTFDPAQGHGAAHEYEFLSEEAGKNLYPIGGIPKYGDFIGIAEDGSVYFGMDFLGQLGKSPREAIERLLMSYGEHILRNGAESSGNT
jgi:hypothetical protein